MTNKATEYLSIPEGDRNVALPMTLAEADAKAKELYGPKAYAFDRLSLLPGLLDAKPLHTYIDEIGRYYIGVGEALYGNGATWKEAFAAAAKMAEARL
jgi:hypothetical protein